MNMSSPNSNGAAHPFNRRRFLSSAAGLAGALSSLRVMNLSVAAGAPGEADDYRALVCLFLFGGHDGHNLLIPDFDGPGGYADYAGPREFLGVPRADLVSLQPAAGAGALTADGRTFALPPTFVELGDLFTAGKLAFVANVGSLAFPMSKSQYGGGGLARLPDQLFSHKEQADQWQTSIAKSGSRTGWGGRLADRIHTLNTNAAVSAAISLGGQNLFEVGSEVFQYNLTPEGALELTGFDGAAADQLRRQAFMDIHGQTRPNLIESAYADIVTRAVAANSEVAVALSSTPAPAVDFPGTKLGEQLRMIAHLIAARGALGMRRQVFFAALGGFDTHFMQPTALPILQTEISGAVTAFQSAMETMGTADEVTLFSASDFGRTLTHNGHGSDHGWGNHHFVVGGAVRGGKLYGMMPDYVLGGDFDTGRGRWIPEISVDEYAATLAKWFGVPASELGEVFPNLHRFARPDLGFMEM